MDSISTLILALSLVIIMLGMGLSLTVADFKRVFYTPKAMIVGLTSQLVLLPLIGFLLIYIFPLKPEIAIGVIILAACPGGPTSNLISHLAKGDTALSVSLTAISSFVTLLSIPFIINLGLKTVLGQETLIQLNVIQTVLQVFVIVILPVTIGMWIRARKVSFAKRMESPVRTASAIVFVLVLVGVTIKKRSHMVDYIQQAGYITLILNVLTMLIGLLLARIFRLSFKEGVSISIESGIQNGTLAITIATVLLSNTSYAIAAAVYSIIMFVTGAIIIFWSISKQPRTT